MYSRIMDIMYAWMYVRADIYKVNICLPVQIVYYLILSQCLLLLAAALERIEAHIFLAKVSDFLHFHDRGHVMLLQHGLEGVHSIGVRSVHGGSDDDWW